MTITKQQQEALKNKYDTSNQGISYLAFRRSIQRTIGMDGAVVVRWCNMWLAIETDGYTHS